MDGADSRKKDEAIVNIALVPYHPKVRHLKSERVHGLVPEEVLNSGNKIAKRRSRWRSHSNAAFLPEQVAVNVKMTVVNDKVKKALKVFLAKSSRNFGLTAPLALKHATPMIRLHLIDRPL